MTTQPFIRSPEVYLASHHQQMLEQAGITPTVITARGYRTVTAEETREYGYVSDRRPGQNEQE